MFFYMFYKELWTLGATWMLGMIIYLILQLGKPGPEICSEYVIQQENSEPSSTRCLSVLVLRLRVGLRKHKSRREWRRCLWFQGEGSGLGHRNGIGNVQAREGALGKRTFKLPWQLSNQSLEDTGLNYSKFPAACKMFWFWRSLYRTNQKIIPFSCLVCKKKNTHFLLFLEIFSFSFIPCTCWTPVMGQVLPQMP